jgi:hypothetical protein
VSYDWGPHFIVPSEVLKNFSGVIRLRVLFVVVLLLKELDELNLSGTVTRITNPWYYRRKNTKTWIKIGESDDRAEHFPVIWNTKTVEDGFYEVLGLMHVFVKKEDGEHAIAGQNMVEVTVKN